LLGELYHLTFNCRLKTLVYKQETKYFIKSEHRQKREKILYMKEETSHFTKKLTRKSRNAHKLGEIST